MFIKRMLLAGLVLTAVVAPVQEVKAVRWCSAIEITTSIVFVILGLRDMREHDKKFAEGRTNLNEWLGAGLVYQSAKPLISKCRGEYDRIEMADEVSRIYKNSPETYRLGRDGVIKLLIGVAQGIGAIIAYNAGK